jgi:hypothetical protein
MPSAKVVGLIIGATIGGIVLICFLPSILFSLYISFREVCSIMFKDRAQYLRAEKIRAAWNTEARRETRLRYNAVALVSDWARAEGLTIEQSPVDLFVLVRGWGAVWRHDQLLMISNLKVHKNYFPVREYKRHCILEVLLDIPTQIRFRWFSSGPNADLVITSLNGKRQEPEQRGSVISSSHRLNRSFGKTSLHLTPPF